MHSIHLREQSLKQLGVLQWYSRKVLPGARPSPVFDVFENAIEESDSNSLATAIDGIETVRADASARAVLSDLKLGVEETSSQEPAHTVETLTQESLSHGQIIKKPGEALTKKALPKTSSTLHSVGKQSYRLFRCSDVVVLSESAMNSPAVKESRLLDNILRACNLTVDSAELQGAFNWPVFTATQLASDEVSFETLFSRWLTEHTVGEGAIVFYLGASFSQIESVDISDAGKVIQFDSSLMELLAMPAKKAAFWRKLQSSLPMLNGRAST